MANKAKLSQVELEIWLSLAIHNNEEGRLKLTELPGIVLCDKGSQQLKHFQTSTSDNLISWIKVVDNLVCLKSFGTPGLEPRSFS